MKTDKRRAQMVLRTATTKRIVYAGDLLESKTDHLTYRLDSWFLSEDCERATCLVHPLATSGKIVGRRYATLGEFGLIVSERGTK